MKVGTKSLLFGAHHFILHPIFVMAAWKKLKGKLPDWRIATCIIFHDWGYWGCDEIDGEQGKKHPERGAEIAWGLFGYEWYELCLYHSRHYAKGDKREPSDLCWADKLGVSLEPWWLYVPKACLTGEIKEYRKECADGGFVPLEKSHKEWYLWIQKRMRDAAYTKNAKVTTIKSGG